MKTLQRLERLERLTSWLKSDAPLILSDAAQELGVSLRTISRDLEVLRERGLPIEAERGRGGGVRLPSHWRLGRIALTREETVDLLLGLLLAEQNDQAMQMARGPAIRRKLLASFSHADQRRIAALRQRIRAGVPSSPAVRSSFAPSAPQIGEQLKEAFVFMRDLEMQYRDAEGQQSQRRIAPHYLVLNTPVWYLMSWDYTKSAVRSFRCDRVEEVVLLETCFSLLDWSHFESAIAGNKTAAI